MRPLKDCEFTAFISYAHADDAAWYDWVTHFCDELKRSLAALLHGVKLPPFHLSGENGPVAGVLSDELKRRIEASYAMIIVVHKNYAKSDWCLKELEYFRSLFGDDGFRKRLYIVAMSQPAIESVMATESWKRLLPHEDQLWMSFFDPRDASRPLRIYDKWGRVAPGFQAPFVRLREDFAAKLKREALPAKRAASILGHVFISYRRGENPKDARALYERLTRELGSDCVFIDIEGIEPGEDFVETLERHLDSCAVLIALMGRDWAGAKDERGARRLDDENDFVRIELRAALERGIRVIPVLIDGASMPTGAHLPDDLKPLARRQAVSLDFHKFDSDVGRLVRTLGKLLATPSRDSRHS